jgi:hypothetical protein
LVFSDGSSSSIIFFPTHLYLILFINIRLDGPPELVYRLVREGRANQLIYGSGQVVYSDCLALPEKSKEKRKEEFNKWVMIDKIPHSSLAQIKQSEVGVICLTYFFYFFFYFFWLAIQPEAVEHVRIL